MNLTRTAVDTVSIGGGIRYADLKLAKSGNDLVIDTGSGDKLTINDWYGPSAARSMRTVQIVAESMPDYNSASTDPLLNKKIETFDFQRIVAAFDAARAGNSKLPAWTVAPVLASARISGSDTEALGGVLAHEYGVHKNIDLMPLAQAQAALGDSHFGSQAQPFATAPAVALSAGSMAGATVPLATRDADTVESISPPIGKDAATHSDGGSSWENAIQRWLDRPDVNASAPQASGSGISASATELEIASAWRRTQQLLAAHLYNSGTASTESEGVLLTRGTSSLAIPQATYDALGRISDQRLPQLAGLDEGFKSLSG